MASLFGGFTLSVSNIRSNFSDTLPIPILSFSLARSSVQDFKVQVDESFVPAIQDEVMGVEHLLAEPRNDHVSVDSILYFHEENVVKCYDVENLSRGFEFGLKSSVGGLDSHTTLNGNNDLKLEVFDGLLDDVEIDYLQATDGFSGVCEEYFLDFEFANKAEVLDSGPCEGSLSQNPCLESHDSGLNATSIVGGASESTKLPIAQSECKNDSSIDETVTCESHGAFRNNPCQPSKGDCMYQNSLDIQHLDELDNDHPLAGGRLSLEKKKGSVYECQTAVLREKRIRKPTQRYIEEFSNLRSNEKVSIAATKNKHSSVSSCNEQLHVRVKAVRKIPGEKSSTGTSDARHFWCLKKEGLEYDEEPLTSEFEDESVTPKRSRRIDRRKHQRMWTLSEVMKLVDGISEHGVGRWTDIKRFLFSSSSYRTPIDLRDKWRNLLRASSALKFNKKEAEQNDEHALRPLPVNVIRRVRELAKIHPYPRERGSKKSFIGQVCSSVLASQSKGTPIGLSIRNVRRKKCT